MSRDVKDTDMTVLAVELLLKRQNCAGNMGKIDVSKEGNCNRAAVEMNHSVVRAAYGREFSPSFQIFHWCGASHIVHVIRIIRDALH